ncbi:hypothetical protein [Sandarakinorhabdus sp. DWP1-3-1]|uniref:hypothetical protein n=1 Tax=Sandarakinorhabdus sp. DWP1-3-1 TaxID=2804627 RepID=UPI003CF07F17
MPYRHAWLFIIGLIAATVFAFWRSYFTVLATSPAGFHAHGLTASLWMLLLLAQSYTPHRGRMALHRLSGRAMFVVMPLFAAGSMGVLHSMAAGTGGGDPFYDLWGARLGYMDILAFAGVLYAAAMALRHRRNVRLHAGYMLSTALLLVSPVFGRVINQTVPGLIIAGPQDFPLFGWAAQLASACAALVALWLWQRDPRHGRPWAVALLVIVVQIIGFETVAAGTPWRAVFESLAVLPLLALMAFGLAAGAAAMVVGWTAVARRGGPRAAAA